MKKPVWTIGEQLPIESRDGSNIRGDLTYIRGILIQLPDVIAVIGVTRCKLDKTQRIEMNGWLPDVIFSNLSKSTYSPFRISKLYSVYVASRYHPGLIPPTSRSTFTLDYVCVYEYVPLLCYVGQITCKNVNLNK